MQHFLIQWQSLPFHSLSSSWLSLEKYYLWKSWLWNFLWFYDELMSYLQWVNDVSLIAHYVIYVSVLLYFAKSEYWSTKHNLSTDQLSMRKRVSFTLAWENISIFVYFRGQRLLLIHISGAKNVSTEHEGQQTLVLWAIFLMEVPRQAKSSNQVKYKFQVLLPTA